MRVRLHQERPYILVFDCWAHQVNLIVGDIFKLTTDLVAAAGDAIDTIKWTLNHSYLLGLLHEEQMRLTGTTYSFTLPSITRWTAHFLSFTSLLAQSRVLQSLVLLKPDAFEIAAGRSPEKLQQVKKIMHDIKDESFWNKLSELKMYLKPLATAANVTQASSTRLDHVLVELGRLYHTFSTLVTNQAVRKCVLDSLERRWAKADQDPFTLAVFLNPFIRSRFFNPKNISLNRSALFAVAKRVFRRVFRREPDSELRDALNDYYAGRNEFHPDRWDFEDVRASYEREGRQVNLIEIWEGLLAYATPNSGRHQLPHLEIHILSIVPNSAGCERLFSEMGYVHTKRRARLTSDKVSETAIVRMHLKREHAAAGLTRSRLQREFGSPTSNPNPVSSKKTPSGVDQHDDIAEEIAEVDLLDDNNAPNDMRALAAKLRQDVIDDEDPPDADEPDPEIGLTGPGGPSTSTVRSFFGTQNPLRLSDIFDYNDPPLLGRGLYSFMQDGMGNLQKELEIYDLATRELQVSYMYTDPQS